MARRLANSLCAGIGGSAGVADLLGVSCAYRPLRSSVAQARAWRPTLIAGDRIVIFHGYLDNADQLRQELGIHSHDPAHIYGQAVIRWGALADQRVIGDYCAVVADVPNRSLRVARSPFRGPPLYYHHDSEIVVVGSVPRVFFAAGLPQRLNERRLVDSSLINFTDQEASWFEGISRVPLGAVVDLVRGRPRRIVHHYDAGAILTCRIDDREAIDRTSELMREAVRVCMDGSSKPGITLSGGLDSSQVAVHALDILPDTQRLPSFTFVPEPGYDGIIQPGMIGCERSLVERFAAQHPRIDPHFTANEGYGHDHRWSEFFHLIGGAPSGLTNLYPFHGLFSDAKRMGCDLLLVSDWGNNAFSDKGTWGYVEYLLTGRWRQLYLALRHFPLQKRSLFWRFIAQSVMPFLPDPLWAFVRRLILGPSHAALEAFQPFSADFRELSGGEERLRASKFRFGRYQPLDARHARQLLLHNDDGEGAEIYQGFEQLYGIPQRDPLAYRPLVEFCWSLPTRMFMRDGETRWLAKQTAVGLMPEEQRANRLNGRWDADWHLRIGRRRADFLNELERMGCDERFRNMFDIPRLKAALEDWPEATETKLDRLGPIEFAVPRALLAARFINFVEGRNQR